MLLLSMTLMFYVSGKFNLKDFFNLFYNVNIF